MKTSPIKQTTILWADDDPDELMLMHEVLEGFDSPQHIVEAANGKVLLDYLENAKQAGVFPCLIVLDLNMPILNGKETLALLKQDPQFKNIPTVVFTTSANPKDKQYCESNGVEMITKPITFAALKEVIQKLLSICKAPVKTP